jgi:putative ABC transport system permease protein
MKTDGANFASVPAAGGKLPIHFLRHFFSRWVWRMAWRDTRTSRRKLALYSCSIVLGIAALAAVGSLDRNLEQAIAQQTKELLGADLALYSRDAFTPAENDFFQHLGGEQSRDISLATMIYFPKTQGTRLVQVQALSSDFPFYGRLGTEPTNAAEAFHQGKGALVEETLLRQFGAHVGDPIKIGNFTTRVTGRLEKVPGENVALSAIAPRVYIPMKDLPRTGLLQTGSLAHYAVYFKFSSGTDVPALPDRIRPQLEKFRLGHATVAERERELGRSLDNLYHFLNLAGFIALLLGGVGIASAIHAHIKQKLGTVAVLRCLGGSVTQTFAVYLSQGLMLGLFGAAVGGALGVVIQEALPKVLADFIPFTIQFQTAWLVVARAMIIGLAICLLFATLPLLTVRRVSPLAALRASLEPRRGQRDPLLWLAGIFLAAGIVGFALTQSRNWRIGLEFAAGLGVVFGALTLLAKLLMLAARKWAPARLPFVVRQGVANLHRPNNRTLLLILSLGLGTFLLTCLYLAQQTLLQRLTLAKDKSHANVVLFDIQSSQTGALTQLIHSLRLPVLDEIPIVTMRLSSVKGRSVESILAAEPKPRRHWEYTRDYRSTFGGHLRDGEKIVAGHWISSVTNGTPIVPISLEQGLARNLGVGLGDELVFNVQGVPITTRVASLRQVEWRRFQPNFYVEFPKGALEDAPAMHVLLTRVTSSGESAQMQQAVVKAFPNVSIIDLTLVLKTVDDILNKISLAIRLMAMFTVLTGLLVLVSALAAGRYQRVLESVLLRTLGASRRQVLLILLVEYAALGFLAALTGVLLAVIAAWALAAHVFHTPFAPTAAPLLIALLSASGATAIVGLLMSRGVLNQPPLAILRTEV